MKKDLTTRGEIAAERFLLKRGYEIAARNWIGKSTYINIVAEQDGAIVFVWVRTNTGYLPENNVTDEQVRMFEQAAAEYLIENPTETNATVRFDLIDINVLSQDRALIRHHIDACNSRQQ